MARARLRLGVDTVGSGELFDATAAAASSAGTPDRIAGGWVVAPYV